MKIKIFLLIFCLIALASSCFARQLTSEEKEFYGKLKNCTPMENPPFTIAGFENDSCKVLMTIEIPRGNNTQKQIFTYKYPRKILKEMISDAINLSKEEFNTKWVPREQEFCESVTDGEKVFYFK
jgi:hypothetical protein